MKKIRVLQKHPHHDVDALVVLLLISRQAIHYTLSEKDFFSFLLAKSFKIFLKSKSLALANGSSLLLD